MSGGYGYRNWKATWPSTGAEWRERDEFSELSDRSFHEHLRTIRSAGNLKSGDIVLISVVRNEALRLPLFFEHFKKLGVTRFLMVDNDSEDATPDLLLAEPLADVFHTGASYADTCCGIYWHNGLARALCIGHWRIMADVDELLVYEGMEEHRLPDLIRWLEANSLNRLFAPMVDIYPSGVVGETQLSVAENLERNSWFDTTGYALRRLAPGWLVTGDPRQRLFAEFPLPDGEWISKYPLFHMNADTVVISAHFIWPRDEAPARPFGALVHLKFLDDFAERSVRNEREGQHYDNARRYRIINEKLAEQPRLVAFYPKSVKYTGPASLIQRNLLLPISWKAASDEALPHLRTLGAVGYRHWTGVERPLGIRPHEREEFEDFSLRSFDNHLVPIRSRGHLTPGEIGLICVLRNEEARLPLFFDHYKRLGVARFFMIDNNSEDGSRDLLLAEPLADIFHAHALFSEGQGGLYWAQAIARLYGEGNWLLKPDADELFVYDRMAEHDLKAFALWLERHGMDRVHAPMIDVYPSSALGRASRTIEESIETDSWFDNDGYSLEKWPQGWRLTGGPCLRIFRQDDPHGNLMCKYPFFQMRADTLILHHHWHWPYDGVTRGALGAIVHLKLMDDLSERSERYEREGQHWNNSSVYRAINRRLKEIPEIVAFYEGSKRYHGPRCLIRHGMMMPVDWESDAPIFADQHGGRGTS